MANYKPVGPEHMMLVKGKDSPNGDLAQIIHSPEELLALFDLQYLFPREFSFYFNSSPGGETASGASLDHWHWQMFRLGEAFKRLVPVPLWVGPDAARSVPGWPAQHRIFSPDQPTSARQLFKYAHVLHAANNAYNVFRGQLADGAGLTALFPRWRGTPVTEFMGHPAYPCHGVDSLVGLFGSETSQASFDLMQQHPFAAEQVLTRRLTEITQPPDVMRWLDVAYRQR